MKKLGKQTTEFLDPPQVNAAASIVGSKEQQGPLGGYFEEVISDPYNNQATWDQAQIKLSKNAVEKVLQKDNRSREEIDLLLGGDLLNQTVASNFAARQFPISFLGLFGACSTIVQGLAVGSMLVEGGAAQRVIPFTSSHYQATERQFRTPNEYGDKYPPYKQRTVTGAGAFIVSTQQGGAQITEATLGQVVDLGVKDPKNLGAAMAPAAADTIVQHLTDTGRAPADYDLIATGDLGEIGKGLTQDLLAEEGCKVEENYDDCGVMIYNSDQKVGAGGSGCACSAVVLASYLLPQVMYGQLERVLIVGTGALLNSTIPLQGESIPCIAHAVVLETTGQITTGIGRQSVRDKLAAKIEPINEDNSAGDEG